jgi:type II secretory pathway component PulK
VAILIAVVALAVVSVVAATLTWNSLAGRRLVERRERQLQAEALARAGVERAAARLLTDPASYRGETIELVPGSEVRIELKAAGEVFDVTSEARFPKEGLESVKRTATRTFRRTSRDNQVRLEVVPRP